MNEELKKKIDSAENILRNLPMKKGEFLSVSFSGGRDSCVVKHIVTRLGLPAKYFYMETTLESDMLLDYLRTYHPEAIFLHPDKTVEEMIREKKYMPTTFDRFCCAGRRESAEHKRMEAEATHLVYGTRREEGYGDGMVSRRTIEPVQVKDNRLVVAPLYDWTKDDVMAYVEEFHVPLAASYQLYGALHNCLLCPLHYKKTNERMMQYHPECIEKMKALCFYCWENNPKLRQIHATKENYWKWYLECDNVDYMRKLRQETENVRKRR